MIGIRFPNVLTRNFEGECDYVPSLISELFIDEEEAEEDYEIIEMIKDAILIALQDSRYSVIYNLSVSEYQHDILTLHFQIPRWSIEQDSMNPDERAISYYGFLRFSQFDKSELDNLI